MFWPLAATTAVLALMTILPLSQIPHGIVRICDFPRLQIAGAATVLLALTAWLLPMNAPGTMLVATDVLIIGAQLSVCLPFTPLWRKRSMAFSGDAGDPATVRIIAYNAKMSNRRYGDFVELVRREKPDIFVVMETGRRWLDGISALAEDYPNSVEHPLENSYGIALYSRLPLTESRVDYRVLEGVPSITTTVRLRNGAQFRLYALHPEPPVPTFDTAGRDAEIVLVGREIADDPVPAIVTGDLNDVAWSHTTRRFQRISGMLDPRIGRGFFNSFDARYFFIRWPLDHLFHHPDFQLVELKRLPYIGSDHFPMLFALALTGQHTAEQEPDLPEADDEEEAEAVVEEARRLRRGPIGTDWET